MEEGLLKKLQDKDFAAKILEFGSKEEVKSFLKSEGYEISNEELKGIAETLKGIADKIKPLSDEELEATAGGIFGTGLIYGAGMALGSTGTNLAIQYIYKTIKPPPPPKKGMRLETKIAIGSAAGSAIGVGVALGGALVLKKLKKSGWWSDAKPVE